MKHCLECLIYIASSSDVLTKLKGRGHTQVIESENTLFLARGFPLFLIISESSFYLEVCESKLAAQILLFFN